MAQLLPRVPTPQDGRLSQQIMALPDRVLVTKPYIHTWWGCQYNTAGSDGRLARACTPLLVERMCGVGTRRWLLLLVTSSAGLGRTA
jgi:hypothetical protein